MGIGMNDLEERLTEIIQNEVQVLVDGYLWRFNCDGLACFSICWDCDGTGEVKRGRGYTMCHKCFGSGAYQYLYDPPAPPGDLYERLVEADQQETDRKFMRWLKAEMKKKRIRKLKYWWMR